MSFKVLILILCAPFWSICAAAEHAPLTDPFPITTAVSDQGVIIHFSIPPDHYLYKDKILLNGKPLPNLPQGHEKIILGTKTQVIDQNFSVTTPVHGVLSWQGCASWGFCYPPQTYELGAQSVALIILTFLGVGLALSLTPCVLPLIPITLSAIKGKYIFANAISYGVGLSAGYGLLGALFAVTGQFAGSAQDIFLRGTLSILLVCLALVQLEVFHLKNLGWQNFLNNLQNHLKSSGRLGVFFIGALSALGVSPCLTPGIIGALSLSHNASVAQTALNLALVGAGLAIPLLLVAIFGQKLLPRSGKWQNVLNKLIAYVLIYIALDLLIIYLPESLILATKLSVITFMIVGFWLRLSFAALGAMIVLNATYILTPVPLYTLTMDPHILEIESKKPHTLVSISAKWCAQCSAIENQLLRRSDCVAALQQMRWTKLDITNLTDEQQQILKKYGIFGPPAFVLGSEIGDPIVLMGLENAEPLIKNICEKPR